MQIQDYLSKRNICYKNNMTDNCLTFDNINIIFDKFYKDKFINNGNPDKDKKYILTSVAIAIRCIRYHRFMGKTLSDSNHDVMQVGQLLTDEQYNFILSQQNNK
ncbi:MAG: hypothetical protein H7832_15370 [Magnetococcus sp. DMHC-6]